MSTTALYRKYRPSGFEEIIGQEHIVQTISNAVAKGTFAHAYLFAGPRGTGKTTIARILAKAVNCDSAASSQGNLCGTCQNCLDIAAGKALDIIEIDAASNRGIDEIRELREGIRLSPTRLKYKVYIIDEAHQLTKEAFNALLKTLEEPPEHALFVFATTVPDKIPSTILSRVQRFDFKKFSADQIIEKLKRIGKKEKIKYEEDALRLIAVAAEGGLRDAESILAQVLSHSPESVTEKSVQDILGIIGFARVGGFVDILLRSDLKEAIEYLNVFHNEGGNPEEFLKAVLGYLRKMALLRVDEKLRPFVVSDLTDDQFARMLAHSKAIEQEALQQALYAFIEAQDIMKKTSLPLLPIELALMKLLGK